MYVCLCALRMCVCMSVCIASMCACKCECLALDANNVGVRGKDAASPVNAKTIDEVEDADQNPGYPEYRDYRYPERVMVKVCVQDFGVGISADNQRKLFLPCEPLCRCVICMVELETQVGLIIVSRELA